MREDIQINERALVLSEQLVEVLESIYDPEIELDIYNLGLVYEINIDEAGFCKVIMTFTDSGCSCADTMPGELVTALKTIDGIEDAQVEIVWSPAWKMTRISRLGRLTLGISPKRK
ncbi:metal-sulfur cluster assembly factor [Streptococcus suis]|uniref:metal-sulfur cluster assembly factor n=2 Tax=Streptococcus suis TaxID=1307 RepID=UPI000C185480|nr:metal-sulfur cluster assembly factor [Streptococcus suis]